MGWKPPSAAGAWSTDASILSLCNKRDLPVRGAKKAQRAGVDEKGPQRTRLPLLLPPTFPYSDKHAERPSGKDRGVASRKPGRLAHLESAVLCCAPHLPRAPRGDAPRDRAFPGDKLPEHAVQVHTNLPVAQSEQGSPR